MLTRYDYRPLDPSKNEIRLVQIFPMKEEDDVTIRGEVIHATLEDTSFIAVSYAWHDATLSNVPPDSQCVLHFPCGSKLSIGRNLAAFLFTVQKTISETFLWIDAICINQEDVAERNTEVARMRDIYSAATDVLVWLGPEENNSDMALSLIGRIAHQNITTNPSFQEWEKNPQWPIWPPEDRAWIIENILNGCHIPLWNAFNSLLERAWWVRVWMCQELALAVNLTFLTGLGIIPYSDLYSVILNISGEDFDWIDNVLTPSGVALNKTRLDIILDLLNLWRSAQENDLLRALWLTVDRLATDERDKVYGILGIASDAQEIVPAVDYSLTVSDVYKGVAESMIKKRGDLDYLSLVFNRICGALCPPWIPSASRTDIYMFNTSFFPPYMRSFCFCAAKDTRPVVRFDVSNQSIIAEGFVVDVIDGRGPIWSDTNTIMIQPKSNSNHYGTDQETFRALWMTLVGSINELSTSDESNLLAPDIFGELFAAQCDALENRLEVNNGTEASTQDTKNDFASWYFRYRNWMFAGRTICSWAKSAYASFASPILSPLDHESWRQFDGMWRWLVPGRRLASTMTGLLGLVPDSAQPGDIVCILLGGRMPFVLRPLAEGHFLVGDSYIHDAMNGEMMKSEFEKKIFNIR